VPPRPIQNPPNPWHTTEVRYFGEPPPARLTIYRDASRSIVSGNDSPDLGFDHSVNPYRGCIHACAYCYARPTHQWLDFGAGTDFDRKITVKPDAPQLLRRVFARKSWAGALVMFSGVTDCYQPLEASYRLTRGCLEVCREFRNPVGIITKSPLVERDLDVLVDLHRDAYLSVGISIPLWDRRHARALEPYVAAPQRRIETIRRLAQAGLNVTVMVAPIIPGLSDVQMTDVLAAAAEAGAKRASMVMLRLPGPVAEIFETRLREAIPLRADKVLAQVRAMRPHGGASELDDPRFGVRMRGEGAYAETIEQLFSSAARRHGLSVAPPSEPPPATFRRPSRPDHRDPSGSDHCVQPAQLGLWPTSHHRAR
jgi:DNA repair photolyase